MLHAFVVVVEAARIMSLMLACIIRSESCKRRSTASTAITSCPSGMPGDQIVEV